MIVFRLGRLPKAFSSTALSILTKPLAAFVFFYFLFSSTDYFNVPLIVFRAKLTNFIAFSLTLSCLLIFRKLQLPRRFFFLTLAILSSMCISALNSQNLIVCIGFIIFFAFNYVCYFLLTYNLFRFFHPEFLLKIYFYSFYCAGFYALCQVLFSTVGIILPGVSQYIFGLARGQFFAYEPSFYALYMTPFAMYSTAKFLLQKPSERKIGEIFWPNLLLLTSTSTGCFFSYLFFLFFMLLFRLFNLFKFTRFSAKKLFIYFSLVCLCVSALLWVIKKDLIVSGFLKFFYKKGLAHFSVQDRLRGLIEYWNIFLEHPLIGVGFGSGPYYIAQRRFEYIDLLDPGILNNFSPMNATTEILAGLGIMGAVLFLWFFYLLFSIFRTTLKIANLTEEERVTFLALSISICVMFATLQFNQSIMRCYMWIHIGIFCGYARYLKEKYGVAGTTVQSDAQSKNWLWLRGKAH